MTPAYYKDGIPYSADGKVIITITNAPPGMVSLGVNADGEEVMTVVGGDGGTSLSGGQANIMPGSGSGSGSGSVQADLGKKTLSRLQAESSAAIAATAKWSTENLKKTQAAQAERVRATMAAQQAAKASQDKLTQRLMDVTNAAIQKGRAGPSVTDLAHQNNMEMAALAEQIGRHKAWKKAEEEARKAEESYQATLRAQEEAQRQQAEIERKLKEAREREAAAKAKAEADRLAAEKAEARAKAEAERRKALFAKAGVQDTPVYTPERVKAATTAMMAPGAALLNRAPGMIQLSAVAARVQAALSGLSGVLTATAEFSGWISSALWRGVVSVAGTATATTAGPMVAAASAIFFSPRAGEGSDRVPGRNIDMLAAQASLFTAMKTEIKPGMKTVDLPVRGFITTEPDGRQSVKLVRTGAGGVPATVPVLSAVRDKVTGLDKITVPAVAGAPSRTILVNPVPVGPAAPFHTGNNTPVPVTPVHTGTDIKQADSIVTTTLPVADIPALQDFIYWQPDATGTGVEPVYVMFSGIYGETNAKGQYSGRDYNTDKAGGPIQNLDWKTATIDRAGVDKVKLHTGRFGASAENAVMIDRLEKILKGELQTTDTDKRYYTHEVRELERYRALGIADGTVPENDYEVWNNTHTATLEDYRLSSDETLLYTPEALNPQK